MFVSLFLNKRSTDFENADSFEKGDSSDLFPKDNRCLFLSDVAFRTGTPIGGPSGCIGGKWQTAWVPQLRVC